MKNPSMIIELGSHTIAEVMLKKTLIYLQSVLKPL
jgi:hypothetical protein